MQGFSNSDFVQVTNPSLMQYFCEVVSECALFVGCVTFKREFNTALKSFLMQTLVVFVMEYIYALKGNTAFAEKNYVSCKYFYYLFSVHWTASSKAKKIYIYWLRELKRLLMWTECTSHWKLMALLPCQDSISVRSKSDTCTHAVWAHTNTFLQSYLSCYYIHAYTWCPPYLVTIYNGRHWLKYFYGLHWEIAYHFWPDNPRTRIEGKSVRNRQTQIAIKYLTSDLVNLSPLY